MNLNKLNLKRKAVFLSAVYGLLLLLGNPALACIFPSNDEMRDGRAMDCCIEHCRMETNPQAAQQACQQSWISDSQDSMAAGSASSLFKAVKETAGNPVLQGQEQLFTVQPCNSFPGPGGLKSEPSRSVELYLLHRSLRH